MRVLRDVPGGRIENHDRKRITKHSNEPDRAARRARAPRPGPLCELCVRPLRARHALLRRAVFAAHCAGNVDLGGTASGLSSHSLTTQQVVTLVAYMGDVNNDVRMWRLARAPAPGPRIRRSVPRRVHTPDPPDGTTRRVDMRPAHAAACSIDVTRARCGAQFRLDRTAL